MRETIIELSALHFHAQGKHIVNDVSLGIEEGETIAFVGPSGCGKSSVLKLSAGLILPTDGKVLYRGQDIANMSRNQTLAFRKAASFVFQDSALWANQNIRQILELPLKTHYPRMDAKEMAERIKAVLAETGYRRSVEVRPAELSMGEQKLVAFARALICEPNLLFLDEWTESLDDASVKRLINIVRQKQNEGATVAFVSHNTKVIRELAFRIVMIVEGAVTMSISAQEFAGNESLAKLIEKGMAL